MSISVGQTAPDFTLYGDDTEAVQLSDLRGRPVLLLFFPGAFTSVCTDELNQVSNDLASFGKDTQVLGISTDSPFVLNEFKKTNKLQFPLLSDHNGEVSAMYGAKYDHDFTHMNLDRIAKRAAFLIDEEGSVAYAEVVDNAGTMPDLQTIKETAH